MGWRSFNPDCYSENNNSVSNFKSSNVWVTKGDTKIQETSVMNHNEINLLLKSLYPYFDTPISQLKGESKQNFQKLVNYVGILHGTDEYSNFYDITVDVFKCTTRKVKAGTIGGYICGCLPESDKSTTCNRYCTGSMPKPVNSNDQCYCDNNTILALYNGIEFDFTILYKVKNSNSAIIHVNYHDINSFPGFSKIDKQRLLDLGIEFVKLRGQEKDTNNEIDITRDFESLNEIKTRTIVVQSYANENTESPNVALIIAVVMFLLVIAFITWRFVSEDHYY